MIIGTGIDIVEIKRMEEMLQRTPRIIERILTEAERTTLPSSHTRKIEFIAGRFAAKEAISKAMGVGIGKDFSWHSLSILPDPSGKPVIVFHHPDFHSEVWQQRTIHLSISHEKNYAVALAIIETR